MTRQELLQVIKNECATLVDLFETKNNSYGNERDAFYNFIETARRIHGNSGPHYAFRVLLTFMDKHLVALANKGLDDHEVQERLRDVAVYSLIGIAMAKEHDSTKPEYPSVEIKYAEGVNNKNAQGNSFIPRPTDYC